MSNDTASALAAELRDFAQAQLEASARAFFPDLRMPRFFGGHLLRDDNHTVDLAFTLSLLREVGAEEVAGIPAREAIARLLAQVDGAATGTFWSYRTAETLLAFGPWAANPIVADMPEARRAGLLRAIDATAAYDPATGQLRGMPNNYWAVLARCEHARQRLGVLADRAVLDAALRHVGILLTSNPSGFMDDSPELGGRFDIYSVDFHLFLEPLWPILDAEQVRVNLRAHLALLDGAALENGALVAWGRSTGVLSLCITIELAAAALAHGLSADPARDLGLIRNALDRMPDWFDCGLVAAHRHRSPYQYRGPQRLLQMTFDVLGKLAYAATRLASVHDATPAATDPAVLFPSCDRLIDFGRHNAGVWVYRDERTAFQLPLVGAWRATDYAPWFHSPGVFECPVDTAMMCGVPRVAAGGRAFCPAVAPASRLKQPGSLSVVFDRFIAIDAQPEPAEFAGRRTVTFHAEAGAVSVEEAWSFAVAPEAVAMDIPEADVPIRLEVESAQLRRQSVLPVDGQREWRSFWNPIRRVHQLEFEPAREIRVRYRLTPTPSVLQIPSDHDYNSALYGALPPGRLVVRGSGQGLPTDHADALRLASRAQVFHIGWPEHLFQPGNRDRKTFVQECVRFAEALGRSPVKVVWTMHNRLPHAWEHDEGRLLYDAWARIADGVIHHSRWGMELMRRELPYRPHAVHAVIPHGHYGEQMRTDRSRSELERELELPPCEIRIGLVGRSQKERGIALILEAFAACRRPGLQLLVQAIGPQDPCPVDPRIIARPRIGWLPRAEIARHVNVCDALVVANEGPTYLTSGTYADAVGVGIPLIVNQWPFFREILGGAGLYFDGTAAGLTSLFDALTPESVRSAGLAAQALQPRYAWPTVAGQLLEFYNRLGLARPQSFQPPTSPAYG